MNLLNKILSRKNLSVLLATTSLVVTACNGGNLSTAAAASSNSTQRLQTQGQSPAGVSSPVMAAVAPNVLTDQVLSQQKTCDAQRSQLRAAAIKSYGIDQLMPGALKLVAVISSPDMVEIKEALEGFPVSQGSKTYQAQLATQLVFNDLTAAQRKTGITEIEDNANNRIYTLGSAMSEIDHSFEVGTSWPASQDVATNGDADGINQAVLNYYPLTGSYQPDFHKRDTSQGASPTFVKTTLMDFVTAKLPSECSAVASALDEDRFNIVNDLLN